MNAFECKVLHKHTPTKARVTRITTAHGEFETPVFMPVGTRAGVNNMTPQELLTAQTQIILGGNTYHMLCAPGMEMIQNLGGMHPMMGWSGPMLTDSGGFQVFSLSRQKELCTIDEEGAHFKLQGTSDWIHMTPEMSLQTQKIIGADIIMAFDQCTPDQSSESEVKHILQRTHRWLMQSYHYQQNNPQSQYGYKQALFGIIQGGIYPELRRESAEFVTSLPLEGIAIGGETIGFDMPKTVEVIRWIEDLLPEDKPRYTMGVGMSPQDLLDVVAEGVDMFDCVAPTRNARHGALYCGKVIQKGDWLKFESEHDQCRIQLKKACYANDFTPVMPDCNCYTCQHHTRSYLHHLLKQKADSFTALASIHNIHVMNQVCATMREFIKTGVLTPTYRGLSAVSIPIMDAADKPRHVDAEIKYVESLELARQMLKEGKILVYPTEAVYGIGCDALNEQAVLRLLALKKRSQEKGLIILIHDWAQLSPWIKEISPEAMQKVKDTWPGPVTWLFPKSEFVPDWISGDSPFVAIRMTAHPIARELCLDFPIVSTSANLTAASPAKTLTSAIKLCTVLADGLVNGKLGEATQPSQIIEVETGIKRR